MSQGTDAMQQNWSKEVVYPFPPFSVISRVLKIFQMDQMKTMILIGTTWHGQFFLITRVITAIIISDLLEARSLKKYMVSDSSISTVQDSDICCAGYYNYAIQAFHSKLSRLSQTREGSALYCITS